MDQPSPLICFYGDDFTGSGDALAQLHRGGSRGVLLFGLPPFEELEGIARGVDVLGIAGIGRSLPTEQMEAEIRPVFESFARLTPRLVQYKICSTFDSSPTVGSFGRVLEIGRAVFGAHAAPVLPAQPEFGRYTVFGNHFAAASGVVYRLDRHPTMSRHPSTPMDEADLVRHLRRQTTLPVALMDLVHLSASLPDARRYFASLIATDPGVVVFDALDNEHLVRAAELIWPDTERRTVFALGSGGLGYGLGMHLHAIGVTPSLPGRQPIAPVDRALTVAGSAAQQTAEQIEWAMHNGWTGVRLDTRLLVDPATRERTVARATTDMLAGLAEGPGVIVYTTLGPDDPVIDATRAIMSRNGISPQDFVELVGSTFGALITTAIEQRGIRRVVIAGGDTSGRTVRSLNTYGLEVVSMLIVAGTLCRLLSRDPLIAGVEVLLKGGQVGDADLFETIRHGRGPRALAG